MLDSMLGKPVSVYLDSETLHRLEGEVFVRNKSIKGSKALSINCLITACVRYVIAEGKLGCVEVKKGNVHTDMFYVKQQDIYCEKHFPEKYK